MKFINFGLFFVLVSGVILEISARPASQAIQARQRRRNRHNIGQRRIILARQAAPIVQQQQTGIYEEELPTAITETDFEPNQRIAVDGESQRLIGTGFGNLLTNKATLFSLLASTSTTTSTTIAPTTTAVVTLTGTFTATPIEDALNSPIISNSPQAIAPTQAGVQRQQQVFLRPIGGIAQGPLVIRRRHGAAAQALHRRRGAQVVRLPIRLSSG